MNRKVFLSFFLIVIMLMSMLIPVSANDSKIIMKMTNPADATSWKMGRYSNTAGTADNADNTHTKIGDYAFKISDFYSKNNGVTAEFSGVAVGGATKTHLWVYGDVGTYNTVNLNATLMLKSGNKRINHKLVNGWQLITWSLTTAESQSEITGVTFSSFGYGNEASSDPEAYKAATMWIDGLFVTANGAVNQKFTGASIKEGEQLVKHDIGAITFNSPAVKSIKEADISFSPEVSFTPSIVDGKLKVQFGDLAYGTNYTVSIKSGVYDELGMEFEPFELNFRVRGENENCPPTVELLSPSSGDRFIPEDEITLSAYAWDDPEINNGSIEYVEFLLNGEAIEGSKVTDNVDGVYTYILTDVKESLDSYKISARAVDNNGAEAVSEEASVRILGYKNPVVSITSPKDATQLTSSVSGVTSEDGLTVTAQVSDLDNAVEKAEVYLDDALFATVNEGFDNISYTFTEPLTAGSHNIKIVATDEMGLTGEGFVTVTVVDLGVVYPALLENDLTLAKWNITGNISTLEKTDDSIIISTSAKEDVQISRTLMRNLSISPWQAELKLIPADASHSIEIGMTSTNGNTLSLITFEADGTLNDALNTPYEAGREYTVSIVADTIRGKMSCLIDGKVINTVSYTATNYSADAAAYIKHSGANAKTIVTSLEYFTLKEAAQLSGVTIQTGTVVADTDNVPLLPDYITVDIEGGTDETTIDSNVKVYEKDTGNEVAVSYKNGKVYFEEVLKSGKEYEVAVSGSVANSEGNGLAGIQTITFTAEKAPVHIEMTEVGSSLKVVAENTTGSTVNAKIVMIAFNGNKAILPISVTDFAIGAQAETTVAFPAVSDGCVIEAFVVDNLTDLNPISDLIYIKK